ncbi:hypothetical protein G6F51_013813 [Rhizopus arrhizus]|uniref:Uncharacterized protein n=1 Tax=Rhizopus oryzae TaxID=64495 RepID=A0A9P7C002_RHIOR|nr:hypothetical protein G6F51_013813 [Rhizopus arrhizus]
MFIEKPYHQELYVQAFANSFYLRKILVKRFEEIKSTARQIERWVSSDGLWGKKTTRRIENVPVESRLLWFQREHSQAVYAALKEQRYDNNWLRPEIEIRRISYDTLPVNQPEDQDTEK